MGKKKKVKPGLIELHPSEPVIIVNYEMQIVSVDDDGTSHVAEKQYCHKKIRIKAFNPKSNTAKIAKGVISHCKYIHPNKEGHVVSLLQDLKHRMIRAQRQSDDDEESSSGEDEETESDESEETPKTKPKAKPKPIDPKLKALQMQLEEERRLRIEKEKELALENQLDAEPEKEQESEPSEEEEEDPALKELQLQLERERQLRLEKEEELHSARRRKVEEAQETERLAREAKEAEQRQRDAEAAQKVHAAEQEQKRLAKRNAKKMKKLMKQQLKIEKEMERNMPSDKADIGELDRYIENLYESDMTVKIRATYHILQLVQAPEHLAQFVENKVLIGALGRMLHEERKKNNELISNILEIFFCFSNFSQLHPILINAKIGATTMQIISHENKRYELAMAERSTRLDASEKLDDDALAFVLFLHRQEKLLYICFYVLLNLAEDLAIETKMVQLGIVKYAVKTLQRVNVFRTWLDELLILLLTFVKKLALFVENKDKLLELGVVPLLFDIVGQLDRDTAENDAEAGDSERSRCDVELAVIRLLMNLSFDATCKQQICEHGLLRWLVECLHLEHTQELAVKCLYNLSIVDEFKSQICYTSAVGVVIEMIIDFQERLLPKHIMALAVNLSACQRAVDLILEHTDYLALLIKRAHRTLDPLLMKLIHNLSCAAPFVKFKRHLHELLGMAKACESHAFLVEVLGTISNLTLQGTAEIVAYHELIVQYNLREFFAKLLSHSALEDDLLIAIIGVVGCFAATPSACALFAEPRFLRLLLEHIAEKLSDEEIALQSVFTLFKLLLHRESREQLCAHTQCVAILHALSDDANSKISSLSTLSLDIIADYGDAHILEAVTLKRFEQHNQEWIRFIESLTQTHNADAADGDMNDIRPLSPTELATASHGGGDLSDDDDDEYDRQQNMHFMDEFSDDESDEASDDVQVTMEPLMQNIKRLAMFD